MKTLGILVAAASLSLAAPAVACPHRPDSAPKTAEKAKDDKGQEKAPAAPAKEEPKQDKAPEKTETAKAKEPPKKEAAPKKPEKVSQK